MALLFATSVASFHTSGTASKPHVVFCLVDDLGWNTVYNNPDIKAPAINALAAAGVKLTSFYAYRYCSPTRASFLTGRTPMHLINTRGNLNGPDQSLSTETTFTMLPKRLRAAGYYSYQVGKWHQGENARDWTPVGRGFDESFGFLGGGEDHYSQTSGSCTIRNATTSSHVSFKLTDYWTETAGGEGDSFDGRGIADCSVARAQLQGTPCPLAQLEAQNDGNASAVAKCKRGEYANCVAHGVECLQCKPQRYTGYDFTASAVASISTHQDKHSTAPLFMYLALHNTHMPCEAPVEFSSLYNFSDQSHNNRRNVFDGMVSTVDSTVLNVTDALKKAGMWANTLFVWACDNGSPINAGGAGSNDPLRGGKGTSFEGGTRVPAFLSGGLPALATMRGRELDGIVAIADFFATILSLAGLAAADPNPKAVAPVDGVDQWAYFSGSAAQSARTEYVYEHLRYNESTYGQNISACTYHGHMQIEPCFGAGVIRQGDWKLVNGMMGTAGHYGHFSPNNSWANWMYDIQLCSYGAPCLFNVGTGKDEAEHHDVAAANPIVVKRLLAALKTYDNKYHPSSKPAPDETEQVCEEALKHGGWVTPFKLKTTTALAEACPSDCSLNGECIQSACVCDPGWIGADCAVLNVGPAPSGGAFGVGSAPFSSPARWGGNAIFDPATKQWHMFSTEIPGSGCGLHDWQGGSSVIHSTSPNVLGPYTKVDLALPHQAHNPEAIRMPDGRWFIFHIGSANSKSKLPACNESHDASGFPPWTTTAAGGSRSACPPAPSHYTLTPGACVANTGCSASHCNCGPELLSGACDLHDTVAGCVRWAQGNCSRTPGCSSFAIRTGENCSTSTRWALHAHGGAAVPNGDWTAYVSNAPAPGPGPGPSPPKPKPEGSELHVADSPCGPWTPVIPAPPSCNNPSPALHPNGTLFLVCTWFMMSAASPLGPWSAPISIEPTTGGRPFGAWEDPDLWFDARGNFHILAHVYNTNPTKGNPISGHAYSKDGFNWTFSSTQPYNNTRIMSTPPAASTLKFAQTIRYATLERPKLIFNGTRPVALTNGASPFWNVTGSTPCAGCLKDACVMCKVSCQARGTAEDLDWTITLIRPILH